MVQHFNMIFVLITASILNTYIHTSTNSTWNLLTAYMDCSDCMQVIWTVVLGDDRNILCDYCQAQLMR